QHEPGHLILRGIDRRLVLGGAVGGHAAVARHDNRDGLGPDPDHVEVDQREILRMGHGGQDRPDGYRGALAVLAREADEVELHQPLPGNPPSVTSSKISGPSTILPRYGSTFASSTGSPVSETWGWYCGNLSE